MEIFPTRIPDVIELRPTLHGDERGFFMETYRASMFNEMGIDAQFVQDNHSRSAQNILRGLHYQVAQPQGKLVRVVRGEVYDVAVDLRAQSPTYGQWVGLTLSEKTHNMLWVPPGFAHGFYVLSETADFFYKCTDYYAPEHERALRWNDPAVGIEWPILSGVTPILSTKDSAAGFLSDVESYL